METPEPAEVEAERPDDTSENTEDPVTDETLTESDEDDIEEVTIDPTEEELGGGLFDGLDEADEPSGETETDDTESGQETTKQPAVDEAALGDVINDGAARLAVVGLTEEDFDGNGSPTELEQELRDVFEAFRLGYFGSRAVEKHVMAPGDREIDPLWGLFGAMLMAAAITLMMRPDGSEQVGELREVAQSVTGGLM